MGGWQGLDESVDRGPLAITFHGSGKRSQGASFPRRAREHLIHALHSSCAAAVTLEDMAS